MSSLVNILKERLGASEEVRKISDQLKIRGVRIVEILDNDTTLTDEEKGSLAEILGGLSIIIESIEQSMTLTGSGADLKQAGVLQSAYRAIQQIDEVLSVAT